MQIGARAKKVDEAGGGGVSEFFTSSIFFLSRSNLYAARKRIKLFVRERLLCKRGGEECL